MKRKSMINTMELAYAPLTGYEFALIKNDPLIELAIQEADIYLICQRPTITFENFYPEMENDTINFEIHQKGNPNILYGKLPLIQPNIPITIEDKIAISLNYMDKSEVQKQLPFRNLQGFSIVRFIDNKKEFLVWFSPEKLLQNWWKGQINCEIKGDFESLLKYQVHYVGKATKQSILKRLAGHNTFQDILSIENPITIQDLPSKEITILMFEFEDNIQISTFGIESNGNEMLDSVLGNNFPSKEKISLDVEKALIKAMQPKYNKELFKNYPQSKDGLYNDNYDVVSYSIVDPITLKYKEGEIIGKKRFQGGDTILIKDNKTIELIKTKV